MLHLIDQGNVDLAKSITLTISSRYIHINISSTNSNTSYSDTTRQNVQSTISFSLNEHIFPLLSNVCQPVLSNVSESCLHQRKSTSNVKLGSVHVSFVSASSVSELIKSLNISKLYVPVMEPNVMSVTPVVLVNSLNQLILVNPSVQVKQLNVTSVTPVVLDSSLNH